MRCVCQLTNAVVEPILFRHLVVKVNPAYPGSTHLSQLRDLAGGKTNASIHAQALTIHTCGESGDSNCTDPFTGELLPALESLRNIRAVK